MNNYIGVIVDLYEGTGEDNIMFLCGDMGKNLLNGEGGKDNLSKYYLDIVYGNIDAISIKNGKLKKHKPGMKMLTPGGSPCEVVWLNVDMMSQDRR